MVGEQAFIDDRKAAAHEEAPWLDGLTTARPDAEKSAFEEVYDDVKLVFSNCR